MVYVGVCAMHGLIEPLAPPSAPQPAQDEFRGIGIPKSMLWYTKTITLVLKVIVLIKKATRLRASWLLLWPPLVFVAVRW